ncbi:MAG: ribosome biogenesis GTP-binding protein YihA/YsxC, partial [Actinomycetota bacterium]|nr:ribosome biogenesis GTP-binding protein YihA/YsxC [Actinomycetota bacterium]
TAAEIAVVGRSNVGKSSIINALANCKDLAKTSATPGRTQLINLFSMGEPPEGWEAGGPVITSAVVDLPGYGYSSAPKRIRDAWQPMIEGYLLGRRELAMIVVLVDGEIGPTKLDAQMLAWLRDQERPFSVVATKEDKVKRSRLVRRRAEVAAGCELPVGEVLWVSAAKGTGVDQLRRATLRWLAAVD